MSNAIGMCRREVLAAREGMKSRADRFLIESETYRAFERGEDIGAQFDESRAEPAHLVWTHDLKTKQICRPFPVAVDWIAGVVRQEDARVYGILADVRDCLRIRNAAGRLAPLNGPSGKTMADADRAETQRDYETLGTVKPGSDGGTRRIGQDWFRSKVMTAWDGRCAVTGCPHPALLNASHIVAWSIARGSERLDENNGILLVATLDAAFDRGLISFADDGRILIANHVDKDDLSKAHIHSAMRLREIRHQSLPFLARHRVRYGFAQ